MAVISHPTPPMPLRSVRKRRDIGRSYFHLGYAGLLAGAVVVVCVLSILYLAQTGRVATRGYRLQQLQDEQKTLLREAEQYQFRIAQAQRLDVIQEKAARLGLRPATVTQIRYLDIPLNNLPSAAQP